MTLLCESVKREGSFRMRNARTMSTEEPSVTSALNELHPRTFLGQSELDEVFSGVVRLVNVKLPCPTYQCLDVFLAKTERARVVDKADDVCIQDIISVRTWDGDAGVLLTSFKCQCYV
jgi:hypothetical protein